MHLRQHVRPLLFVTLAAAIAGVLAGPVAARPLAVTVAPGQSIGTIAARHGVSIAAIAQLNGIPNPNVVQAGRRLRLPGGTGATAAPGVPAVVGTYVVRAGDTLGAIAGRLGMSQATLVRVNGLRNPNVLSVGTRLRTPGGRTVRPIAVTVSAPAGSGAYVVRPGDTLGVIAARLGVSQKTLERLNRLRNPNVLSVGTRLRTPGALGASPAAQPAAASAAPSSGFTGTYVVRQGDTLAAIAGRVGASQGAVASANGIRNPNVLVAGTTLRVPAGVPGAVTVVAQAPEQRVVIPGPYPTRSEVAGLISAAAGRFGVDVALVRAVAWQESGWYQGAVSPTGALGIMQLQPSTASWVGPSLVGRTIDPMVAADNVAGGAALLAWLLRQTAGDRALALAGYYQGLASVRQRGMLKDTQGYVAAVTSLIGRV